ncbi:MAG: DUF3750 domain-containing protein [Candidatus Parcubacteria bacterium]|nr:DUF3750 domain-containing protein [Candidatus Parcubacteria bacterium]
MFRPLSANPFEKILNKEKYQVFLFACPANIPFSFAAHPWFVINKKGTLSRWEVTFQQKKRDQSWGYLSKNLYPLFSGIETFPFQSNFFWKGKLLNYIEGGEGSTAQSMAEFIEHSPENYPHNQRYSLSKINSNTYAQWVLNHFRETKLALPWNALGKKSLYAEISIDQKKKN